MWAFHAVILPHPTPVSECYMAKFVIIDEGIKLKNALYDEIGVCARIIWTPF